MKTKLTKVTPDLARSWLKENTHNRNVRQSHVDFLAGEMKNGRWQVTHQGICIAEDGVLIDGQHRLLAVVQSGVPVEMMITHGAKGETQDVVDIGMSLRQIGDMLHLQDKLQNASMLAASCKFIVSMCGRFQSYKMSVGLTRIVHEEVSKELGFIIDALGSFKPVKKGWIVGVLAFCLSADKRAAEFISKLGAGENLKNGDPAKTLRDWFSTATSRHLVGTYRRGAVEAICNAIHNSITNQSQTQVKSGSKGIDYFISKKRSFVDLIRDQVQEQYAEHNIAKSARKSKSVNT